MNEEARGYDELKIYEEEENFEYILDKNNSYGIEKNLLIFTTFEDEKYRT